MHFICRSLIGKNNPNCWSQYWENEPDDDQKHTKGHLFGLISLKDKQSEQPITIGHDILSEINQLYFSQTLDDINLSLKNTLVTLSQNPIFLNYQIDLAIVVIVDNRAFLATYGTGNCILQRKSQISLLISGQQDQSIFSHGQLLNGDRLLLASSKFIENITWEKIKTILVEEKIQTIEENFLSLLYSTSDQNQVSAVLIECFQEDDSIATNIDLKLVDDDDTPQEPTLIPPQASTEILSPLKKPDSVYINNQSNFKVSHRKRTQLIVAIFLIISLCVSIFYGNQKNKTIKAEANYKSLKTELELKINNINTLKSLDLGEASRIAKEAKDIVDQMSKLNIHQQEILQYQPQIDSILFQTGGDETVVPPMVQDTNFIVSNPQFDRLFYSNEKLYLLDSTKGRIDILDPQNKSNQSLIISDSVKSTSRLLFNNGTPYLLKDNKLFLVEKNNLTPKFDFNSSEFSINITDVNFWNGSLYVLDNQNQSIWKLTPNSTGFSAPQKWLKNDLKLEIGANSFAIDGQVWVLNHSGQINPYTSGIKDKFSPKQVINFSKTTSITTSPDSDLIVFKDNTDYIYVFKKNGELNSKFNLSKLKIVDITFNPIDKIIYFLSVDQKIYQIPL